jgi:hypothetical protein
VGLPTCAAAEIAHAIARAQIASLRAFERVERGLLPGKTQGDWVMRRLPTVIPSF